VLIAPVLAIEEDLAVYRIHGNNLCAPGFQAGDAEAATRLVLSSNTVKWEVEQWIRAHRQRVGNVNTRRFLDGLVLLPMEQQFRFCVSWEARHFSFLARQNYALGPTQGWLYTTIKYVVAFSALVVGYEKYLAIHAWCGRARPLQGGRL